MNGLTRDPATGLFVDANGQYFTQQQVPEPIPYSPTNVPIGGTYGINSSSYMGFGKKPVTQQSQFMPFTGNAFGITNGKRSVVDSLISNRQPYQYKQLGNFLSSPMQSNMGLLNPPSQNSNYAGQFGAGRFLNNGSAMQGAPMNTGLMQQSIASKAVK